MLFKVLYQDSPSVLQPRGVERLCPSEELSLVGTWVVAMHVVKRWRCWRKALNAVSDLSHGMQAGDIR